MSMAYTLDALNSAPAPEALRMLDGIYEHSPWIAEQTLAERPFQSLARLKHALQLTVQRGGELAQKALWPTRSPQKARMSKAAPA
jgi:beta-ureidopropionase / N-carbamoyl-L-amino-acid hydrolase